MPAPVPRQRAIPAAEGGQGTVAAPNESAQELPENRTAAADAATPSDTEPAKTTTTTTPAQLTLLLIEDDPGGTPIVPDLLDQAGRPIRIRTARNLTEAERLLTDDVHCILLDLALPAPGRADDGDELAVLRHVLELAPRHAVLALTGADDTERGAEAVRVGAQDYLVRDELDGR
ncbi:response regulator, partial [Actinospica acidiphila]|nr:response regulator [Actinospica acidiphila]